jgi:Na+-driven multidrug efflux pump
MLFLGVVGFVFVVFSRPLVALFTADPDVAAIAVRGLRIISSGFLFYAYGMVLTQAFNGAGDTLTPTLINLFCFWLFDIPIAYVLTRPGDLGPSGVFWAIAIAYSVLAIISVALFKRGRWKLKKV